MHELLKKSYPVTIEHLPAECLSEFDWRDAADAPELFLKQLEVVVASGNAPPYLAELAKIELARERLARSVVPSTDTLDRYLVNPSLEVVPVSWQPLLSLFDAQSEEPRAGDQVLLFWREPGSGRQRQRPARADELLAIKVLVEELDPLQVAKVSGQPVGVIDAAIETAVDRGLLLRPPSTIRRDGRGFPITTETPQRFLQAEVFTLQWHITHRCDLHCRHCYDRSRQDDVTLAQGLGVLDQLRAFCLERHVRGQVSFSGGNPFLHPDFFTLYQGAVDRNLGAAILGNPVAEAQLDQLLQIGEPAFFQVSLEGLEEHNDHIRGPGNFARVVKFLELLREKGIYSMVMLTLTRANLDQVLPLGELLRDKTDLLTYNRLSMVGEGASLESPGADEMESFIRAYLRARQTNPVFKLKDSLFNIELRQQGQPLFGGCTGFGCGAAFNFISLLPDGRAHACRKFPSPIGDLKEQSLAEIYDSGAARNYRNGCRECRSCTLRPVCGGCLAVSYGYDLDPLQKKDPACFLPGN